MHTEQDLLWTWLVPDIQRDYDRSEWQRHGGKWIVFDAKKRIIDIAGRLGPLLDNGDAEGAEYWDGDPSALCVYSLVRDRKGVVALLDSLNAGKDRVWE